eukprot:c22196_g1_i1 orf=95-565(+)
MPQIADFRPQKSHQRKQLVFDCRYGWVYDEWMDPAEVAHLGGLGMFSVVPLITAIVDKSLTLANFAADVVVEKLQNPPSLESLHGSFTKVQSKFKDDWRNCVDRLKSSNGSCSSIANSPLSPVHHLQLNQCKFVNQFVKRQKTPLANLKISTCHGL